MAAGQGLGWLAIARLGLVQAALGAIVVLTTSTLNRVMVVELALPAMLPGLLVAWHYALQVLRPRWGHGTDGGRRRTPWIIAGMAALAVGGLGAALSVHLMTSHVMAGIAAAVLSFTLIGGGVGAAGTSLLVLIAAEVAEERRAPAATMVWITMIIGFIVTAALASHFLHPFSTWRLVTVAAAICGAAFLMTVAAVWGVERGETRPAKPEAAKPPFRAVLAEVWADPTARNFAVFIFVSMLAYSAQDLILEPFAGLVFGMTPAETTAMSGLQNSGVLLGMLLVGGASALLPSLMSLRGWTVLGCLGSALALIGLVAAAKIGPGWPLKPTVFALGFCNGVFAVAAIGAMFGMAKAGASREGVRMGLFGASQAIAFGIGGFAGTVLADAAGWLTGSPAVAYAAVFAVEAALFVAAAALAVAAVRGREVTEQANPLVLAARQQAGGS
jgi:BCD family chlorophyll transporter-like MFS transporter